MRKQILLMIALVVASVVITICPAQAQPDRDQDCSDATLRGSYAFTIHGAILAGPAAGTVDGIALSIFDGEGNMAQVDVVSHNGTVAQVWRPGTATYDVESDCTGTMTLTAPGGPPLDLAFVIAQQGKEIHTVVINPGFAITSDAVRTGNQSRVRDRE
ncbi:MAG: hypothetical protein ACRD2U_14180 [Terriglobales bacterium]